jgi:hypothetical protein
MPSNENQRPSTAATPRGPAGLGQEAATFLGSRPSADSGNELSPQEALRLWGAESGRIVDSAFFKTLTLVSNSTSEAEVFYNPVDHRAWKCTWSGAFGFVPALVNGKWRAVEATPSQLLGRLYLQNEIFQDEIKIEGIRESSGPSIIIGQPANGVSMIFSQPWIEPLDQSNPYPSDEQVAELMMKLGFERLPDAFYGWIHPEGIVVLDAKPDYFILSPEGVVPIDLQTAIVK